MIAPNVGQSMPERNVLGMTFFFLIDLTQILLEVESRTSLSVQSACVLVPYLSLPGEQLMIGLGSGSLSLVLSGSEHYYASLIPHQGLNKLI